jgi:polyhydroxyalkanoate synthase subunit PhaE
MADKPHDFIDQYQAFVRQNVEAWARQFDPKAEPVDASAPDIMGRLFAGLGGYGEWMRAAAAGETPTSPFPQGGVPPFAVAGAAPFGYVPPQAPPPGGEGFDAWARQAREALSMPGLGLTREQQEEQQALLRAWIDYAEHYQRYHALLQGVHERANARMREQQPASEGVDSLRATYDRWVNLVEEAYAEAALSSEFRDVYGALVNAQMRLKVLQQHQVERMAGQAGMPTRKEVDTLGERLQAARRELRALRGLADEVAALRAEVAALRSGQAAAGQAAHEGKKRTAARKPRA